MGGHSRSTNRTAEMMMTSKRILESKERKWKRERANRISFFQPTEEEIGRIVDECSKIKGSQIDENDLEMYFTINLQNLYYNKIEILHKGFGQKIV